MTHPAREGRLLPLQPGARRQDGALGDAGAASHTHAHRGCTHTDHTLQHIDHPNAAHRPHAHTHSAYKHKVHRDRTHAARSAQHRQRRQHRMHSTQLTARRAQHPSRSTYSTYSSHHTAHTRTAHSIRAKSAVTARIHRSMAALVLRGPQSHISCAHCMAASVAGRRRQRLCRGCASAVECRAGGELFSPMHTHTHTHTHIPLFHTHTHTPLYPIFLLHTHHSHPPSHCLLRSRCLHAASTAAAVHPSPNLHTPHPFFRPPAAVHSCPPPPMYGSVCPANCQCV